MSKERSKELLTVVLNAWANRSKIVDTQTLAMGALGLTNTEGEPFMSEVELSHPLEFLMLNQLATPLLDNIIPDEVPDMLKTFMSGVSAERVKEEISRSEEINNLKAELKRLQETVGMQQNQINELSKKKK